MIERRLLLSRMSYIQLSFSIINKIFNSTDFENAKVIGIYVSHKNEVDTHALISQALTMNKKVVVPKIVNKEMIFVEILSLHELEAGTLGILKPESSIPFDKNLIDVMYVPVVAYNKLNRLGFGKGYYDSYLRDFDNKKIGLAFKFQECEIIQTHDKDVALDEIITE